MNYGRQNTHRTSLPLAAKSSCSFAIGDWVVCNEDYDYGIGDASVVIKKGEWLELESVNEKAKTVTLVDGSYRDPVVYSDIPVSGMMLRHIVTIIHLTFSQKYDIIFM